MSDRVNGVFSPDVSVVIVSYNTADLIVPCLLSVVESRGVSQEVFVVDNASNDGGADLVREKFPSVRLVVNPENRGFGAANNQVLADCAGRYIVLLNPDTEATPEAVRRMVSYMDSHPGIGLAGPTVRNPDGSRQDSVSLRYPGQKRAAGELSGLPGNIACVMGACQIVRSGLMRDLGGFDEEFFLYGEDQDLCLRIRKAGFEIGCVDDAVILHHGGKSERGVPPVEVWTKKAQAEYTFHRKHYSPETVRRIARAHLSRERRRILLTRILLPFVRDRARAEARIQRYRVVYDIALRHLEGERIPRDTEGESGEVRKR